MRIIAFGNAGEIWSDGKGLNNEKRKGGLMVVVRSTMPQYASSTRLVNMLSKSKNMYLLLCY